MHWLTESEIDDLTAPTVGLYLTFFGLALGAAISFGITLATVGPMSPKTYATFVALFGISLGGVVLFGAKSWMDYRRARRRVAELKQGRRTRRLASDHA